MENMTMPTYLLEGIGITGFGNKHAWNFEVAAPTKDMALEHVYGLLDERHIHNVVVTSIVRL